MLQLKKYKYYNFVCLSIFLVYVAGCCKTSVEAPDCSGYIKPIGNFKFLEVLNDTAFEAADTIFLDNYVNFKADDANLSSYNWVVGNDPRVRQVRQFTLSFVNKFGSFNVNYSGTAVPNFACNPTDSGRYTKSKTLTIVEQVKKPFVTISPLVGKYRGYFLDAPAEVFTVRMEYFDSAKYNTADVGSKNFYWFSNMPNGYVNHTNAGLTYPECSNGQRPDMVYKCFTFGSQDNIVHGKAWLVNDTLNINYGGPIVGRRKWIGKRLP
jgi:hypothetical protein